VKGSFNLNKRRYPFLVVITLLVACAGKPSHKNILSKQEMVKVMEDIYVGEEKVNRMGVAKDSAQRIFSVMASRIFQKAGVTDSVFKRSFDYYMDRPDEMEAIYSALVDTLHLKEQRMPFRPDQP
jgi:hypothetical protein